MTKLTLFDQLIDQYKLQEHIAQQSVTDLYLAHDIDENRAVALEILLPHYAQNQDFVERFVHKMRKVAQLNHPNIAKVLQVGIAPTKRPYITREYVEDYSLAERLAQLKQQKAPINSIYALKLVRQIAETLALAERLDIFHYSLRPERIMLKLDGTIVMVDLGIPTLLPKFSSNHRRVQPRTFDYFPPEQLEGKEINSRSHVYSIGAILHELLVGQPPAAPSSFWTNIKRYLTGEKTSLEQARPDLSAETYRLVDKCLRWQPWSRFQKIEDLINAIDEAIRVEKLRISSNGAIVAEPSSPRAWARFLLYPALLLFLCGGISLFAMWSIDGRADQPTPAGLANVEGNMPSSEATVDPDATAIETPTPEPTALPDGTEIQPLQPPAGAQVELGSSIVFRWSWPIDLEPDQQFVVYVRSTNDWGNQVGTIPESAASGIYWLEAGADQLQGIGDYWWHIAVVNRENDRVVAESDLQNFKVVESLPTPTPTREETAVPSVTPTASVTTSPTPRPEVRVIVSSGSLRAGPGTNYNVLRYLWDGDRVLVIAKDPRSEWYNVQLTDGSRGWLAASVSQPVDELAMTAVPFAATIPASPTPTNTPTPTPTNTPTNTPTPTPTPTPSPVSGNGGQPPPPPPPTDTPEPTVPPTLTPPPPSTETPPP